MKTRRILVEERPDGTLVAHALQAKTSPYWARNKARAISGLTRNVVHICVVRETVNVPEDERS